jgi:putative acetyltransferase
MNTAIRQYQASDLKNLMVAWENANALAHPFLQEDFVAQVRKDIPALYLPNADTWVAKVENHIVGFIALIGNEVGAIFLQPEHHGKRIGKMMMDKAQELHGSLELEVFKKNTIGRKFYSEYGFELLEEKIHEPTGEPVLRLKFSANK